jgi:peptidoglycan/LPS O-acetylase OafA/YrhL
MQLLFSRILSSNRRFVPEVDGLRFVAIAAVVVYHLHIFTISRHMGGARWSLLERQIGRLFETGSFGVQLFFVLSGFLLALPFARWRLGLAPRPSLKTYYLRRLTRIEPPYVVAMLLVFASGLAVYGSRYLAKLDNLFASLLYLHNLIYGEPSVINGVAWSLEIEVQFYLLAPLLATVFSLPSRAWRRGLLTGSTVAAGLLTALSPPGLVARYDCLLWRLDYFLAGFLLADFFIADMNEPPRRSLAWDLASVFAWPALIAILIAKPMYVPLPLIVLFAYLGAFRGRVSRWIFSRPTLVTIGGMCYSIYLVHFCVIWLSGWICGKTLNVSGYFRGFAAELGFGLPAIAIASAAFFLMVERPCMNPDWPARLRRMVWFKQAPGTNS